MYERHSRLPAAPWSSSVAQPKPVGSCGASCSAAGAFPVGAAEVLDATDQPLRVVIAEGSSTVNPPVFSRAVLVEEGQSTVGFQVFVVKNTIDFSTSVACSLEGSNDDENWGAIASSTINYGSLGVGLGFVRVTNVAWRYVRVRYAAGSPEFDGGVAILQPTIRFFRS